MLSLYDVVLASALEGLRRKPILIMHFLVALTLAGVGALLGKLTVTQLLRCTKYFLNYTLSLIITLTFTLIALGFYVTFWYRLEEHLHEHLPKALDNALKDYRGFLKLIADNTLYDFIDKEELKKAVPGIVTLLLSYYSAWVFGLYSVDLILYIISNHRYTIFGYLTNHAYLLPDLFLASVILGLIIRPWPINRKYQSELKAKGKVTVFQYLHGILRRFSSYKGLGATSEISSRWWGKIALSYLETLASLPSMTTFEGLLVTDVHQVPYTGEVKKRIISMIKGDVSNEYVLEPLKREGCEKPPETEIPLLSEACWYKVKRRVYNKAGKVEERAIGYVMIIVLTRKKERIDPDVFKECLNNVKKYIRRNCQGIANQLIQDLKKLYLEREEVAFILLLGTEELLGLKLALT